MRRSMRFVMVGLWGLLSVGFLGSSAYAGLSASLNEKPPDPPFGQNVQGDAGGTKLYGTISIDYQNIQSGEAQIAKAILRVRKGNELHTFTGEFGPVKIEDISTIQTEITDLFSPMIVHTLFNDEAVTPILKEVSEYSSLWFYDYCDPAPIPSNPSCSRLSGVVMEDVVIAVK